MKKLLLLSLVFTAFQGFAQIPTGYYDDAEGLEGEELREVLQQIIDNHNSQSYSSLWNHFEETDQKPDGTVWDMYSDNPDGPEAYIYNFGVDQCGNYSGEGSCYNREHSFPKSWFNDQSPMNTDLFHLYPTDGYTNGQRSNYPFGETDAPTWTSTNGSKRGPSSVFGFVGVVFEPIDEYKGDFARTYFYMLTRYKDQIDNWNSFILSGDDFSDWARLTLLIWNEEDPVSQKEIDRNNAVYEIQDNRNPFIDNPEFTTLIWGEPVAVEEEGKDALSIWYSDGQLYFSNSVPNGILHIHNMLGQTVYNESISGGHSMDLNLDDGMYIVRFQSGSEVQTLRIVE